MVCLLPLMLSDPIDHIDLPSALMVYQQKGFEAISMRADFWSVARIRSEAYQQYRNFFKKASICQRLFIERSLTWFWAKNQDSEGE